MSDLKKKQEERNKIISDQRELLDDAEKEKRDLTPEEEQSYDKMDEDFIALTKEVEKLEARESRSKKRMEDLERREFDLEKSVQEPIKPETTQEENEGEDRKTEEYRAAFRSYLRFGLTGLRGDEYRALQADLDPSGGFLVAPEQFVAELIKEMAETYWIRQFARVISVPNAASLGLPVRQAQMGDPTWTAEIKTGTADTALTFSKRQFFPHPLARRILVSNKLLRVSTLNVEAIVRDEFVEQFGEANENGFLTGTGANEPLGLFTASSAGISTGRDVSTGNTTTAIKADGLVECLYSIKAQHRRNARWIFHRDAIKAIRKLKTGEGDYIWRPGIATDRPDTILGKPFHESEYAPNTFTTGLYVGLVGDLGRYFIADALDMQIQVLDQLYAESNQTGYIARMESDGAPTLENAFARVTLA